MTDNNQSLYTVDIPLEATMFGNSFPDSKELVQRLKAWALTNKFVLVIAKSDDKRVHLRCKFGQQCQIKIEESERKRSRKSVRRGCPFILKIAKSSKGICFLKHQDILKNEHQHNHNLSVETAAATSPSTATTPIVIASPRTEWRASTKRAIDEISRDIDETTRKLEELKKRRSHLQRAMEAVPPM